MSATIEEVHTDHEEEHDHDHDHEGHDHEGHDHDDVAEVPLDKIQSRAERKARKALLGMGLKRIPGINRVTIRRSKNILFVVATPDVYKSQNSECYIVFGEAKLEDGNTQAQLGAQQVAQHAAAQEKANEDDEDDDDIPALEEPAEEEPVDETGLDGKDIELVMSQTGCSRAKAVRVLKESDGDVVNAVMAAS
ncbi:GAL4 enhancer protein [Tulasnella sp. JGI-2019a]|nr:GAL4 enhancer protein [Tulasnella sp. JGI-2019a]KAG9016947.1 GAL4 enhancer protein [Tulasnella sp. JGI-2019a]